jgi:hypothetical protein
VATNNTQGKGSFFFHFIDSLNHSSSSLFSGFILLLLVSHPVGEFGIRFWKLGGSKCSSIETSSGTNLPGYGCGVPMKM